MFALRSRRVVMPQGVREAALLVRGRHIAGIVPPDELPDGLPVTDLGDSVLMPGLVDTHVHVNEPGRTEWEGFASATRAAAAGGITTLVDMPLNATPVTITADALGAKRAAAQGQCFVDVGFHGGLIPDSVGQVKGLLDDDVVGVKVFLTHSGIDEFPNATMRDLHAVMPLLARRGVPLLVHAELDGDAPPMGNPCRYADYLASRPRDWEQRAVEMMITLCAQYRCPVHIVHLSSADAVPALRAARAAGLPLTVETCPHYLFFEAETIPDGDTRFKCAPPIRERENRDRLWGALRDGVIDTIASDHCPCPPSMKALEWGDFGKAWGGISSLQLSLPVVWTEATRRGFALTDMAGWMCRRPARFFGLGARKGVLAPGADADFVVWDPEATFTVDPLALHSRHALTPYEGVTLHGVVRQTWLRGKMIAQDGALLGPPMGELLP